MGKVPETLNKMFISQQEKILYRGSFIYSSTKIWNDLPPQVMFLNIFKK